MTLYAQWKKILTFVTVTFDANGGTGEMSPQRYVVGTAQVLRPNQFTKEGCYFVNWNKAADGSETAYANTQEITLTGNVTLYAQWAVNGTMPPDPLPGVGVLVIFDANGGNGYMPPQMYTVGCAQALNANAYTRENYWFDGWNTAADGNGTAYADLEAITVTENTTLYAQWKPLSGDAAGHLWVDLGLPSGTLWAICNVGASVPEEYGNYYAWGETRTKSSYTWYNYKYCNNGANYEYSLTKYCNVESCGYNGFTDDLTTLLPEDDAATTNWGADWRMPTWEEFNELLVVCSNEWTVQNGVNGQLFTGPNGNTVFFPAAGGYWDVTGGRLEYDGAIGAYWTSKLGNGPSSGNPLHSSMLDFNLDFNNVLHIHMGWDDRCDGLPVRPVVVQ
jgi:uncharacterized repeat protein (TIGR02543 family)